MPTSRKIEPGGPQIGDPWLRYTLVKWSVTAILKSVVNCSSARNGAIPFKVQEKDRDRRRVFLAQCNFGVTFDRYGTSQKERRRDGRKQRTMKTKIKNNHSTANVFTAHYAGQSKVHHGYAANISVTVGWWIHFVLFLSACADTGGRVGRSDRQVGPTRNNNFAWEPLCLENSPFWQNGSHKATCVHAICISVWGIFRFLSYRVFFIYRDYTTPNKKKRTWMVYG